MRTTTISSLVLVAAVVVTAASCSSSSKSAVGSPTPTTLAAPGTTVSPDSSCPFSGATTSQSEPGGSGPAELTSVSPTPAGCIDNVTLGFSRSLAPSVVAYQSTTPSASGAVLVVTLKNATLGSGLKVGTTHPKNVSYVSAVQLSTSSGDVVFDITLDKVRPFLVSSSQVPAQLVISVG